MGVKFILCINRYWTIAARLETGEPAVAGEDVAGASWARLSFSINFICGRNFGRRAKTDFDDDLIYILCIDCQ